MDKDLAIGVGKKVGIISIAIIILMAIVFKNPKPIILGYIFGSIISVISFKLMGKTISKAVKKSPSKASSYTVGHYVFRLTIYGIVLYVAGKADYLNILATGLGLTMVKNTIVLFTALNKNLE